MSNQSPIPQPALPVGPPPAGIVAHSIKTRWLALLLGLTIVAIIGATAIAINTANIFSQRAQELSSQSIRAQAETYLIQVNDSVARQNELILDRAGRDIQELATAIASIYARPEIIIGSPESFWPAAEHMFYGSGGQYMNSGQDTSSVFVPVTQPINPDVLRDIELGGYLDLVLEPIFKNNPNAAAIYFGTTNDVTRYYPNIKLGEVVPPDFQVTQRVWYTSAVEKNPAGVSVAAAIPIWSPVYVDATGLGLVTTVAIPIYDQEGELIGVAGLDLTLDEIKNSIEATRFQQTGYSFLVDGDGKAIILPDQGYQDILGRPPEAEEFGPDLMLGLSDFNLIVERMRRGEAGFIAVQSGDRELFVAFAPLPSSGWSLGSIVAAEEVLRSVASLQDELSRTTQNLVLGRVLPIATVFALILVLLGLVWTNRLVSPIQKLAEVARKIGAGQWDTVIPYRSNDEIGLLATTLSNMGKQLRQSFSELEQRVAERTQQLEVRSLQLTTAAEVARDITTSQSLDELLKKSVNLINDSFDFYNVGVFLVDEQGEYAYLIAASGEAGLLLVQQQIRLRVGRQGIIGEVTSSGRARVVADVRSERGYVPVSLLPDTLSEATLPLRIGGRIIGALDVQSQKEAAFGSDEITVLQTVADQLAIAIENARLMERLRATLEEVRRFSQRQVQESWSENLPQDSSLAYEYNRLDVRRIKTASSIADRTSPTNSRRLTTPIKLREQVIGTIGIESNDPAHQWTDDEVAVLEAVATQAALTLESARLYEETQQRAEQERTVGEITSLMRATLDIDTVLQTAATEIRKALNLAEVEVRLGTEMGDQELSIRE